MGKGYGQRGQSGLILKYLLSDLQISQAELGAAIPKPKGAGGYGKTIMNFVCNGKWSLFPKDPEFKEKVERWLSKQPEVKGYLSRKGITIRDIWNKVKNGGRARPRGRSREAVDKANAARAARAAHAARGSIEIDELLQEVEMLSSTAREAFKLFADPFQQEIRGQQEIFMSEEHRYMFYAMRDAAMGCGFMAIVGEVGSGKSIARKWLMAELNRDDDMRIVSTEALDKSKLTDASICDAIIYDLSKEAPKSGPEKKTRQVRRLLIDRARDGAKIVLIIEEAQDLTPKAFKLLKRLYEIEDGFKKTIGIILIGQPELGILLSEREHPEMREVIRRCQVAEIGGLNGSIGPYLQHKFACAKVDRKKIITDGAIEALSNRLMEEDGRGRVVSYAHPLTVNNLVVRAMNMAADTGEKVVTAEVINAL